jgi:hypothetical protein
MKSNLERAIAIVVVLAASLFAWNVIPGARYAAPHSISGDHDRWLPPSNPRFSFAPCSDTWSHGALWLPNWDGKCHAEDSPDAPHFGAGFSAHLANGVPWCVGQTPWGLHAWHSRMNRMCYVEDFDWDVRYEKADELNKRYEKAKKQ